MGSRPAGSTTQRGLGLPAKILVSGGALLLVIGGVLAYPYIDSRLAAPPAPTPPPPRQRPSPTPTAVRATSTALPAPTLTPAVRRRSVTATPLPSVTPAPALPTRLVIPAIDVDAPVLTTSLSAAEPDGKTPPLWDVPATYAAGWHETSAPLGGGSNTVFNGHNTMNGEVFRNLYRLRAGDEILVYSRDIPYTYAVSETVILLEAGQPLEARLENARYILPTDEERLTLVTCHPYGSLRYRLIVIALPTSTVDSLERRYSPSDWEEL
jgi:LPXTG-site transpeptidase (sortase) family protein